MNLNKFDKLSVETYKKDKDIAKQYLHKLIDILPDDTISSSSPLKANLISRGHIEIICEGAVTQINIPNEYHLKQPITLGEIELSYKNDNLKSKIGSNHATYIIKK